MKTYNCPRREKKCNYEVKLYKICLIGVKDNQLRVMKKSCNVYLQIEKKCLHLIIVQHSPHILVEHWVTAFTFIINIFFSFFSRVTRKLSRNTSLLQGPKNMGRVGDDTYAQQLLSRLKNLRKQGSLCDVTIIIDKKRFQAHKAVLSASSSYFNSMFTSGFQESNRSEVKIEGFEGSASSFYQILDFAYTGYFHLSPDSVCNVFRMAHYMDFQTVVSMCTDYIKEKGAGYRIIDVYDRYCYAVKHNEEQLASILLDNLLTNFVYLAEDECFLTYSSANFICLCLTSPEIENDNEEEQVS